MSEQSLREKVARLVEGYQWDSGKCEDEALAIADQILALEDFQCRGCRGWSNPARPVYCEHCANEAYTDDR